MSDVSRKHAMSLLMQQSPEQRVRCAAGLLFSAAAGESSAHLQAELAELAVDAEAMASEIARGDSRPTARPRPQTQDPIHQKRK